MYVKLCSSFTTTRSAKQRQHHDVHNTYGQSTTSINQPPIMYYDHDSAAFGLLKNQGSRSYERDASIGRRRSVCTWKVWSPLWFMLPAHHRTESGSPYLTDPKYIDPSIRRYYWHNLIVFGVLHPQAIRNTLNVICKQVDSRRRWLVNGGPSSRLRLMFKHARSRL